MGFWRLVVAAFALDRNYGGDMTDTMPMEIMANLLAGELRARLGW